MFGCPDRQQEGGRTSQHVRTSGISPLSPALMRDFRGLMRPGVKEEVDRLDSDKSGKPVMRKSYRRCLIECGDQHQMHPLHRMHLKLLWRDRLL